MAPPIIFPLSVLIVARNGFMPEYPPVRPLFALIKPQYSNACPLKRFGTFEALPKTRPARAGIFRVCTSANALVEIDDFARRVDAPKDRA
jgi:hypothetical protein